MYIAHQSETEIHTIAEHSEGTAKRCGNFGLPIWKDYLYSIGLLHDLGKYQDRFQQRIKGNPDIFAPHSLCGGKTARELFGSKGTALIAQYVICGHHSGLHDAGAKNDPPDYGTLYGNLARTCEDYSAFRQDLTALEKMTTPAFQELDAQLIRGCGTKEELAERFAFLTRYCFSCLTDADWLDTEWFYTKKERQALTANFQQCLEKLNQRFDSFIPTTQLQKARTEIQRQVYDKTHIPSPVYLMNMPTGSGKTLCSMKFALERAIASGKKRIIYIIPYNSIIEQTAETFTQLFGDSAKILRHQSTFVFEDHMKGSEEDILEYKLAVENWDAQIILTTAVQFFQTVYSNKRSSLRKLHNMADSILIFDEAHLMPLEYLQPCLRSIAHITQFLNSEVVFLTATMPNYHQLLREHGNKDLAIVDLVTAQTAFESFQKCNFHSIDTLSDEALLTKALEYPSTLIVVNKRSTASALYKMCHVDRRFHLSTYMTALDRNETIHQIRHELEELQRDYHNLDNVPPERRIVVISTSLIEAGVDLDFHTVFRQLWGLDSILQAGGRCNREGKLSKVQASVFIFQREAESGKSLKPCQSITKGLLSEYPDISSPLCITEYYKRLYQWEKDTITRHALGKQCTSPNEIPFASYSNQFEIIDTNTLSIAVIQDEKSLGLFRELQQTKHLNPRAVQLYTFTVYQYEFEELLKQGVLEDFGSGIFWLTNPDYYRKDVGVQFEGQDIIL